MVCDVAIEREHFCVTVCCIRCVWQISVVKVSSVSVFDNNVLAMP